jgi:hypothetical protein
MEIKKMIAALKLIFNSEDITRILPRIPSLDLSRQ